MHFLKKRKGGMKKLKSALAGIRGKTALSDYFFFPFCLYKNKLSIWERLLQEATCSVECTWVVIHINSFKINDPFRLVSIGSPVTGFHAESIGLK